MMTKTKKKTSKKPPTYKDKFCESSFWIKYSLFVINFLIWVGGICLLVIGVWSRLQKAQLNRMDVSLATDPAFMLVSVGVIMFLVSVFGCLGSVRENVTFLKIFCVVLIVVFILQVVAGILAFVYIDRVETHLIQYMRTAITDYQDDLNIQKAVDYIQKRFDCCGSSSYADWDHNVYYNCSSESGLRCGVPISCCIRRTSVQCGYQIRQTGEEYASKTIHTKGCIAILMALFKDNLIIIGFIAFSVAFIELVAVILAHTLIKYIMLAKLDVTGFPSKPKRKIYPTSAANVISTEPQQTHL